MFDCLIIYYNYGSNETDAAVKIYKLISSFCKLDTQVGIDLFDLSTKISKSLFAIFVR